MFCPLRNFKNPAIVKDTAEFEVAEKSNWDQTSRGQKLGFFGEIGRKLAKLSTTFTYRSFS
jgi:hypothetical protein